jgi:SEC-C motif-containing protein
MSENLNRPCPCQHDRLLGDCCGRYFAKADAPTAEQLMRSRYSAFVLQNTDYLLATWHPRTRPETLDFSQQTGVWQRLDIIHCQGGQATDHEGAVAFKAYFTQQGLEHVMHEISRFVKHHNHWLYSTGHIKYMGPVKATKR